MIASSNGLIEKEAERKDFFRFLKEKNDILIVLGIRILINDFNDHFNSDFNSFNHRENKFKGKLNTITEPLKML